MSLTITRIDSTDRDQWDRAVERAPEANIFHQWDALDVVRKHSGAKLHPLMAMNGQEPVGILPLFEERQGRQRNVLSPPWVLESSSLGPALVGLDQMSQRKQERYTREFVDGCLQWVDKNLDPDFVRIRTDGRFGDVRPFSWAGFDAAPYYTYVVDLDREEDDILDSFSRDARSNITGADEDRYEVRLGGPDEIRYTVRQLQDRHAEQDKEYRIEESFVLDLYEALPEGQVRPYVCAVDGEDATGLLVLEYGSRAYRWEGGAKNDTDLPVTDLLDWHAMRGARERGMTGYDLVGANVPRLCGYKAKFSPELEVYYNLYRRDGVTALRHDIGTALQNVPRVASRVPTLGQFFR